MENHHKYRQKTALITGSAHGIGYQLAYVFASHSYNLVLVDKDQEKLAVIAEVTKSLNFLEALIDNRKITLSSIVKNVNSLVIALISSHQIRQKSSNNPDILQGSTAQAFW